MILQSLVRYYEILAADPACTIARPGWCSVSVSFAAVLSPDGTLLDFVSLKIQQPRGKNLVEVPQNLIVPEQAKRSSGIFPNFLCENPSYMFGIDGKGNPQRSLKCFQAFKTLHEEILAEIDAPEAKAILSFLNSWKPEKMTEHPLIPAYQKELFKGANLVFRLDGGRYAHEVPEIRHAWEKHCENVPGAYVAQCLVCGERRPIARLHPAFGDIRGGQSTGTSIVSFNASAYESYGHERRWGQGQGLNAPVSEYAAFAYGTALKKLLADRAHKLYLGDMTIVYWAENASPLYQNIFQFSVDPPDEKTGSATCEEDIETREIIRDIFLKISQGRAVDANLIFDTSVRFCILGLSPNAARLSIRFFLRDTFGEILKRIAQHHLNMRIEHAPFEPDFFSLWRLLNQTVQPNSTDKSASPLLSGSVLRAILAGTEYPEMLYNSVLLRIRAEHDVNYYKAAILKGCLLKKSEKQYVHQEGLTVSLNESCDYKPYVLGRLFSVLEKLQTDAIPGINSTIRDRYFTSASASPGTVFPTLLRLSSHHISKSHRGKSFSEKIQELMNRLPMDGEPFPAQLSSYGQGIFILGYYHQNKCNQSSAKKQITEENA